MCLERYMYMRVNERTRVHMDLCVFFWMYMRMQSVADNFSYPCGLGRLRR